MRQQAFKCALCAAALLLLAGAALAQTGGGAEPGGAVPKPPAPGAAKNAAGAPTPGAKIVGTYGQWALLCSENKEAAEPCNLVQALVERSSQQLVFRVTVGYGPKGNLVLRIDSPTGVALQKGIEFSADAVKIYRLPFQTCIPEGCRAVLIVEDDLKQDLQKSDKGTITVYALDGKEVRALAELAGFADGLAALDKRRAKP